MKEGGYNNTPSSMSGVVVDRYPVNNTFYKIYDDNCSWNSTKRIATTEGADNKSVLYGITVSETSQIMLDLKFTDMLMYANLEFPI